MKRGRGWLEETSDSREATPYALSKARNLECQGLNAPQKGSRLSVLL